MYFTPHFRDGRASLSFDVRLEAGAVFAHEWRDAAVPYRAGPSMTINADGKLIAGGKMLAELPIGKWCHVEVVCSLGQAADGTYDLSLQLPGKQPQVFRRIACGSAKFERLEWLGFVSQATQRTVFYLDNIKLSRD